MEIIAIQAHEKEGVGKEAAKRTRRQGLVPAVIYRAGGGGGGDAIPIALDPKDFRHLVYTSKFKLAEITVGSEKYKCILKDIQFHPVTDAVIHLDFLALVSGIKFKVTVPIRFEGQAPGVKAGGKFLANMRTVKILTTPEYLVDEMSANISGMELGSTLRVRDIEPIEGVEILNSPAVPIAAIEIPRALRQQQGR